MSKPPENIAESIVSSEVEDDDDIEELDEPKDSEIHLCGFCHKLSSWTQFLLYGLLGQLITLTPAVVIIILKDIDPKTIFYNNFSTDVYSQVLRWAFFFNLSWLFLLAVWRVIGATPYIVTSAIMLIFKKCPENIRFGLEFVVVLRGWACLAGWMIFNSVLFRILFSQLQTVSDDPDKNALANQWQTALSVILTLMVLSIFIFIQKFFLHTIAVNFHKRAFADRISKSQEAIQIIDKLRKSIKVFKFEKRSNSSPKKSSIFYRKHKSLSPDHANSVEGSKSLGVSINSLEDKSHGSENQISDAIVMKTAALHSSDEKTNMINSDFNYTKIDIDKHIEDSISPVIIEGENEVKSESTRNRKEIFNVLKIIANSSKYNRLSSQLEVINDRQAKKLGKQIFLAFSNSKRGEILLSDFKSYFRKESDASLAFEIFDTSKNNSITEREMKVAVVNIYREKRAIFNSMQDFSLSLKNLDNFFLILSGFATALFVLPIWGFSLSSILPFTSIILALSFIFGGSARTTFDCLIFLFVYHPYDAGDRVVINGKSMFVETVSLLTTTFRTGGGVIITSPNVQLANEYITNWRRSGHQAEEVKINVDFFTPESKILQLQQKMIGYVSMNNRDFHESCDINIENIENLNRITISFWLVHKSNWQDMGQKIKRSNAFKFALIKSLIDLNIKYSGTTFSSLSYRDRKYEEIQEEYSMRC